MYRWEGPDGATLPTDGGRVKWYADGTLSITNASEVHRGNYSCVVENIGEVRRRTLALVLSGE